MAKAAKKFHTEAGHQIYDQLHEIIKEHHKALGESEFLILFKHGGWDSKGRTILGKAKVVSEDMRSTYGIDAIIYLNKDAWEYLSESQRKYLLDHELCHLDIVQDKNYDTVTLIDGRPKLTTVPHDLEDFVAVVKRHGIIMEDVKRLAKVLGDAQQITIEEVSQSAQAEQEHPEVEEEEDENQVTFDEVMQGVDDGQPAKVTDINKKRLTKKEKEAAKLAEAQEEAPLPTEPEPEVLYDDSDDLPL